MSTNHHPPSVITTFAGCGGSSLGYKLAGCQMRAAVEFDPHAASVYRLNHPATKLLERDIVTISVDELLEVTGLKPGELTIFDGSPPCQGFSTAGKRRLEDPRNQLFKNTCACSEAYNPKPL
jgi:DNA (cytosine-5)-methyltransferase 1